MSEILTIGHSVHSMARFLELLRQHRVSAVADVRSSPYSSRNPQYNKKELRSALQEREVRYVFLGRELGARSDDPACYIDERADYDLIAQTALFREGIERVLHGAEVNRIALVCAEKEPLQCHRTILVARHLVRHGSSVAHILSDGHLETHERAMSRLLASLKLPAADLFRSQDELWAEAYQVQADRIAYRRPTESPVGVNRQAESRS